MSKRDGNWDVYVMARDGSGQRRLTRGNAWRPAPVWSPDGRKIAFTSRRDGNFEVFVTNADGSGQLNLTRKPGGGGSPAWSPDGRKLAFAKGRRSCKPGEGCVGNTEVYVMNADGGGQRRLTRNAAGDGSPAWSPDGRRIAFVSERDGNSEVYVMNSDGSQQRNLTRNPADDDLIVWSPVRRK